MYIPGSVPNIVMETIFNIPRDVLQMFVNIYLEMFGMSLAQTHYQTFLLGDS